MVEKKSSVYATEGKLTAIADAATKREKERKASLTAAGVKDINAYDNAYAPLKNFEKDVNSLYNEINSLGKHHTASDTQLGNVRKNAEGMVSRIGSINSFLDTYGNLYDKNSIAEMRSGLSEISKGLSGWLDQSGAEDYLTKLNTTDTIDTASVAKAIKDKESEIVRAQRGGRDDTKLKEELNAIYEGGGSYGQAAKRRSEYAANKLALEQKKAELEAIAAGDPAERQKAWQSGTSYQYEQEIANRLSAAKAEIKDLEDKISTYENAIASSDDVWFEVFGDGKDLSAYNGITYGKGEDPIAYIRETTVEPFMMSSFDNALSEDERIAYNYLLKNKGVKAARKWLNSGIVRDLINQRIGQAEGKFVNENFESGLAKTLISSANAVSGGIGNWVNGIKAPVAATVDPNALSTPASTYAYKEASKDLGFVGKAIADASASLGNMAPSIAISAINPVAGQISFGASAAGNAYNEARKEGKSIGEAAMYGLISGGSELALQSVLGGIPVLSGVANKLVTAAKNLKNPAIRALSVYGLNALSEGTEEYIQDILDPVFRNVIFQEDNEVKILSEDAAYSFLLGAISAGVLNIPSLARSIPVSRFGNGINVSGHTQNLIDNALKLPKDSEAYDLASKLKSGELKASDENVGEVAKAFARDGGDLSFLYERSGTVEEMAQKGNVVAEPIAEVKVEEKPASEAQTIVDGIVADGEITNSKAERIMDNAEALEIIGANTEGLGSKSQKRAVIKEALRNYQQQTVAQRLANEVAQSTANFAADVQKAKAEQTDANTPSEAPAENATTYRYQYDVDKQRLGQNTINQLRNASSSDGTKLADKLVSMATTITGDKDANRAVYKMFENPAYATLASIEHSAEFNEIVKALPKTATNFATQRMLDFERAASGVATVVELARGENVNVRVGTVEEMSAPGVGGNARGFYQPGADGKAGTIVISPRLNTYDALVSTVVHEAFHADGRMDKTLVNNVYDYAKDALGNAEKRYNDKKRSLEAYTGVAAPDGVIKEEIAAEFIGNVFKVSEDQMLRGVDPTAQVSAIFNSIDGSDRLLARMKKAWDRFINKLKKRTGSNVPDGKITSLRDFLDTLLVKTQKGYTSVNETAKAPAKKETKAETKAATETKAQPKAEEEIDLDEDVGEDVDEDYYEGLTDEEREAVDLADELLDGETKKTADGGRMYSSEDTEVEKDFATEYTEYNKPITMRDVEKIHAITEKKGQVSVNNLTSSELEVLQKWAHKYKLDANLGTKSPFFRAWFGEWRAHQKKDYVAVAAIPEYIGTNEARKKNRGTVVNVDTGWHVRVSREGETNTISHAGAEKLSEYGLAGIRELIENAYLFDTELHEHHVNDAAIDRIALDHKLYALGKDKNGDVALYKITVEESYHDKKNTNDRAFHNLRYIEKVASVGGRTAEQSLPGVSTNDSNATKFSIADLYAFVKRYDKDFAPAREVNSVLLNEDGTPKIFYHGTSEVFSEFSIDEISFREGSFFFAENREDSAAYGDIIMPVYLTGEKMADYDNQPIEFYRLGSKKEQVRWLKNRGYDGWYADMDSEGWGEISVFSANQIKSVGNIGTYDKSNNNIYFSSPDTDIILPTAEDDAKYLAAAESGDVATAERMVRKAAKDAGFITPLLYHGTGSFGFTKFNPGKIYATASYGVAMGYNRGQGLGKVRNASKPYIQNDGTAETAIKNAENILGAKFAKLTEKDKQNILAKATEIFANASLKINQLDSAIDRLEWSKFWDYLNQKYGEEKTLEFQNAFDGLAYLLSMEYTAEELLEYGDWFKGDLARYHERKRAVSELYSEEYDKIKGTTFHKMFSYLLGYEYGDALIDIEFGFGRLLDDREKLVTERGSLMYLEDVVDSIEQIKNVGVYQLYGNPGAKPLVIDEGKRFWDNIPFNGGIHSTDYIANWAKENGYSSVLFKTVLDPSSGGSANVYADEYVFFDSDQLKSADPITYDDNGNIIPLSERFNNESNDIRYSAEDTDVATPETPLATVNDFNAEVNRIYREGKAAGKTDDEIGKEVDELAKVRNAELREVFGTIEPGEKAAREFAVPKKTEDGKKVSQSTRTVGEAGATPETMLPTLEAMIANGTFSYEPLSNEKLVEKAKNKIGTTQDSFNAALKMWMEDGKLVTPDQIVMGWMLYDAANKRGEQDTATEICVNIISKARVLGQGLQAMRILKMLTPAGQIAAAKRVAETFNNQLEKEGRKPRKRYTDEELATVDNARKQGKRYTDGRITSAFRDLSKNDVPVEQWAKEIGNIVATSISKRLEPLNSKDRLVSRTVANDLLRFAENYALPKKQGMNNNRTAAERVADFFANRDQYIEAWNQARDVLREQYKDSPDKLDILEAFLNGTVDYNGEGSDALMMQAVSEAALSNDVKMQDIMRRAALGDINAVTEEIFNRLQETVKPEGSDVKILHDAVRRWVMEKYLLLHPLTQKQIDAVIRKKMVKLGKSVDYVIRQDRTQKGEMLQQITAMLVNEFGVSPEAASDAAIKIKERYDTILEKASKAALERAIKERKPAQRRTLDELFEQYANMGAFTSDYDEAIAKKLFKETVHVNQGLIEAFLSANTDDARDNALMAIYKDIGSQLPATYADKYHAWCFLAMLGNLKTHIRNIRGNVGMVPMVLTKDVIATTIEYAAERATKGKFQASKGFVVPGEKLTIAAWKDYERIQSTLKSRSKYDDRSVNNAIEEGRVIFEKFKNVEYARKLNSELLEGEDLLFMQSHYAFALAQYCKAKGISAKDIETGDIPDAARDYAFKEAEKATFKDRNEVSDFLSKWHVDEKRFPKIAPPANWLIEGVMPFKRTPANILVRGVEYSPIWTVKGVYDLCSKVSKGDMSATEAIDELSSGLTGTMVMLLGMFLSRMGIVVASGADDEKERKFHELWGHQSYSLVVGGKSYTIDWLAPIALPFFVGVELQSLASKRHNGVKLYDIKESVLRIADPMLELSCLQSINNALDDVAYAREQGSKGITEFAVSLATSRFMQMFPTSFGQLERTFENKRMTTFTEKDSFLSTDTQYLIGKISARLPGDYQQIPYIDAWGRIEETGPLWERAYNNFINPSYVSEIKVSAMEHELQRLKESTGETSVYPSRANKKVTVSKEVDGERKSEEYHLSAEDYVQYATAKGNIAYNAITNFMSGEVYKGFNDTERVDAIEKIYSYAEQYARTLITDHEPEGWIADALKAQKEGMSFDTFFEAYIAQSSIKADRDFLGNVVSGSAADKKKAIIDSVTTNERERKLLYGYLDVGKTAQNEGIMASIVDAAIRKDDAAYEKATQDYFDNNEGAKTSDLNAAKFKYIEAEMMRLAKLSYDDPAKYETEVARYRNGKNSVIAGRFTEANMRAARNRWINDYTEELAEKLAKNANDSDKVKLIYAEAAKYGIDKAKLDTRARKYANKK